MPGAFGQRWKELAAVFLKLGVLSYGGAAMMGIMHAEIAERRRWLDDARYLQGVALVSTLPGPPAVQLAVFIGYQRAGWAGGVLTGLCFMLPAFFILLGLTLLYSSYGNVGVIRNALNGIGAVVLAIFAAAVYRLGRSALKGVSEVMIACAAALVLAMTELGVAPILLLAGCGAVTLYDSRKYGLAATLAVVLAISVPQLLPPPGAAPPPATANAVVEGPSTWQLALFFLEVSALTFGGGIAIVAFVQDHVVERMQWLDAREFVDGLALGQLTPGPTLMIAAYIGYKLTGFVGALVSALCIFAPAFFLTLPLLPVLDRIEHLGWVKAALRGIIPAVIGCLVVTLAKLLPHAAPEPLAWIVVLAAGVAVIRWRVSPLPLILGAGLLGMLVGL